MTDDDVLVVQRLRERLALAEPHAPVPTAAIRDLGRRKLRRRRLATYAAAAVAVAAVAVGGALTAGTTGDAGPPVPPVDHPRTFDPDALTSAIDQAVHAGGVPWEQRKLEARGQAPRPLKGPDRAAAQNWRASYTLDDGHALEVMLAYEAPFDEAGVRVQCAQDERFNDDCEILASTATSITQLSERVTYDDSANWPVLENGVANLVGPIPVEHRWYMRTVKDFRSDGLIVMVREMVHAPTAVEAAPLWLESTESLAGIGTDPDLWFPPFPGALEQGDRNDALADLAQEASEHASALTLPTLLTIVNQTSQVVAVTSGNTTTYIEPGKTVSLASERACALIPLRASTLKGEFIEDYTEPCHGQTWEITGR